MANKKLELMAFMEANENPDAPDGAWQGMLEDSVEMFNKENGTNFDPFDMFMEYCQRGD